MQSIDIMFSAIMVPVFSVVLFSGLFLITAACFGNQRAIKLIANSIISGRVQLICMIPLMFTARFFANHDLMLTAYATLYAGVVLFIVFTGFWMTTRHVRQLQQRNVKSSPPAARPNLYNSPAQ